MSYDTDYWESRWQEKQTGWDIGHVSTPIKEYADQLEQKDIDILIPGCGQAWEGEYLHRNGFTNVYLLDIAPTALHTFHNRVQSFPADHLMVNDFFKVSKTFDLIIEQTFFCALDPSMRAAYVEQASKLLKPGGKIMGLLFETDFGNNHPPFGGTKLEYEELFTPYFEIQVMEKSKNSISPRMGAELFILLKKL